MDIECLGQYRIGPRMQLPRSDICNVTITQTIYILWGDNSHRVYLYLLSSNAKYKLYLLNQNKHGLR